MTIIVDSSTAPELREALRVGLSQWYDRLPCFPIDDVITDVVGVVLNHFGEKHG